MELITKTKRLVFCLLAIAAFTFCGVNKAKAQTQDIQQLILDIEKLTQFKAILSDMQTGYTILTQGYGQVKDIAQGNFNLHSAFLNSLMMVSPEVRKYGRIAAIIEAQARIVSEYKSAYKQLSASGNFSAQELLYVNSIYQQLLNQSVNNLTTLADVITDGSLRMSDAERLQSIDHIYADTENKLVFLRDFNNRAAVLAIQRQKEQNEVNNLKALYP